MRGALCVATRLYILYLAADESISGWEFLLLIPKSPQTQWVCFPPEVPMETQGTQIRELMKDPMFDKALSKAEQSLRSVVTNFFGNHQSV